MPFSLRSFVLGLALLVAAPALAQETLPFQVTERGHAARYATGATGTSTASGEPYNPERLTLAHPTLPFGTLVQLTNLANGQTATARVNDRAPGSGDLRVQVSARTADQLGLSARGEEVVLKLDAGEVALLTERAAREKARTKAAAVAPPVAQVSSTTRFTVQIASFSDEARAVTKADEIRGAWVLPVAVNGAAIYRVCYGVFDSSESAAAGQVLLQDRGVDGFVKSLDAPPARADEAPVRPAGLGN